MKQVPIDKIRNVALMGNQDTGKTSFLEAALFRTKATARLGKVAEGNSNLDFIPEEIDRKISMKAKLAHLEFEGHHFNFVDTPGYDDFSAECIAATAVTESALVCVKADAGFEAGTERTWRLLDARDTPRFILVNRMDKEHAKFQDVFDYLHKLSKKCAPVQLPIGSGDSFKGYVDVVEMKGFLFSDEGAQQTDIPAEMAAEVAEAREALMNAAAETSDELVEKFLESGELSDDELREGVAKGVVMRTLYPIMVANSESGEGVLRILTFLKKLGPSPEDTGEVIGHKMRSTDEIKCKPSADAPTVALAFGSVSETNVGDYTYVRVFSGKLAQGMDLLNASTDETERIGPLYLLNGKNRTEVEGLSAGQIGAAVKLKNTHVSNTLCDKSQPVVIPFPEIPAPLTFVAIKAKAKGDEDKLSNGLQRLHEEDPGFLVHVNPETHQTVLQSQGDAHQAVILTKLKRKFGVDVETEKPKTPYRETIKAASDERYRHKKQTGGRGQFGEVHLKLEPQPRGSDFEFVDAVVGGVIPGKFIPAVEKGVREIMGNGVVAGYPVVDIKVTVDDGKHHPVDSSEAAFKMAAAMAFRNAFPRAKPVLLEPIYKVTIRVPEEYMGDVMGDMSSRRGRIQGMESDGGDQVVQAEAPLAELYDYATGLRSLSHGRGSHVREFSHYEEVPNDVATTIIAEYKKSQASD